MAALSESIRTRIHGTPANGYHDHPVVASDKIFRGSFVCVDADGHAVPLAADTHNGRFLGLADEEFDNSSGADGDVLARVTRGITYAAFPKLSFVQADAGDAVYSTTDNPADMTKTSTTATLLGTIVSIDGSEVIVRLQPDI